MSTEFGFQGGSNGGGNTSTYKVYSALISQSETNDPTAIVLEDTIGDITITYQSVGYYILQSPSFTEDKTWCTPVIVLGVGGATYKGTLYRVDADKYAIATESDVDTPSDNLLYKTSIEIRVYP
jgi:hypothetical protein